VVSQVKLIAEPWDVGEGGYQVGNFPVLWTEWNGRYRDTMRDFWRGHDTGVADLAFRLTGSSDLYGDDGRRPYASINFVTCHDGLTLHDLVAYDRKHNEANGEHNRDGESHNRSWNCGVEGETANPEVNALRERQKRNHLASLILSAGVPMLLAGDEIDRTQRGNNNAYCQDNELSWVHWELDDRAEGLLEFTRGLLALRAAHPVFRRRDFYMGQKLHGSELKDIEWFTADGTEMTDMQWGAPIRTLAVFLNGHAIPYRGPRGERIVDDCFLLLLSGSQQPVVFRLPGEPWGKEYELEVDTALSFVRPPGVEAPTISAGEELAMAPRSLVLLRKLA